MKNKYDPKEDLGALVRMLNIIIQKSTSMVEQIDSQINVIISISLAVFVFSATRVIDNITYNFGFLILATFGAVASLVSLFAIHPPKMMRKRGQPESLMYNKRIASFASAKLYKNQLKKIVGDQDAILDEYAKEIFNIYTYTYRPKRKLFKMARNILIIGIAISVIFFISNAFI